MNKIDSFNKLMNLEWKFFYYEELFTVAKGKRLTKADMELGRIPYIGATEYNNGVANYITIEKHIFEGNVITVNYNGSVGEAFYQPKPFYASDDVNILKPKFKLNSSIAMFLCSLIRIEKYRFNYGRKWIKEKMQKSKIKLPIDTDGTVNWNSIEDYIKSLNVIKVPSLPSKNSVINRKISLKDREWKWFKYNDVFTIKNGFYNKKPNPAERLMNNNDLIPFIGATEKNNGLTSWHTIDQIENSSRDGKNKPEDINKKIYKKNSITISNGGSIGNAFYQPKDFTCAHHINVITLKEFEMTPSIAVFLCTLIKLEKYRYSTCGRELRLNRLPESMIKLPVDDAGNPDWKFMEDYIKSLPYSSNLKG